jgi:hypothetical protein
MRYPSAHIVDELNRGSHGKKPQTRTTAQDCSPEVSSPQIGGAQAPGAQISGAQERGAQERGPQNGGS